MKPEYEKIWQNLHIVKHIPSEDEDGTGEIAYQYKDLPCYVDIFYDDGEPVMVIDSTDHLLTDGDFQRIIDSYELAS